MARCAIRVPSRFSTKDTASTKLENDSFYRTEGSPSHVAYAFQRAGSATFQSPEPSHSHPSVLWLRRSAAAQRAFPAKSRHRRAKSPLDFCGADG